MAEHRKEWYNTDCGEVYTHDSTGPNESRGSKSDAGTVTRSEWVCYLFGGINTGIRWQPEPNEVPNWFVRKMMKVLLGCTWIKNE